MTYKYACACGKKKAREFPMGEAKPVFCSCGVEMSREIGVPIIRFVGEGWTRN